jgi:uncharacterized protein
MTMNSKSKAKALVIAATALLLLNPGYVLAGPLKMHSLKEIRERGVVMQRWETSCAGASLATVLTYGFNHPVGEAYIVSRMLEKTDPTVVRARGGFSLLDMKRFVEDHGYRGAAYMELTLDDLKLFHAPIVPINTFGYNHYLVVNSITVDAVLLADPAFGNRSMSHAVFEKLWIDGMAFIVTPISRDN